MSMPSFVDSVMGRNNRHKTNYSVTDHRDETIRNNIADDEDGGVAPQHGLLSEMEKKYESFCRSAMKVLAWCSCALNVFGGAVIFCPSAFRALILPSQNWTLKNTQKRNARIQFYSPHAVHSITNIQLKLLFSNSKEQYVYATPSLSVVYSTIGRRLHQMDHCRCSKVLSRDRNSFSVWTAATTTSFQPTAFYVAASTQRYRGAASSAGVDDSTHDLLLHPPRPTSYGMNMISIGWEKKKHF